MDRDAAALLDRALSGEALALGLVARMIDDAHPDAPAILARTYPLGGRAHIVGITGPPGAGKSTLVSALIREARSAGQRVAVLAVDPTSPFSGGAFLGDRIRMQEHATDPGVFIRSVATRGEVGGLSRSILALSSLLDAAGFDLVLVETVGVGQEEVQVKEIAQTTVFVAVPGLGDGIQTMKAGVLEIADVFVVNKADLPGASQTVADLAAMLSMSETSSGWKAPVLTTVALTGQGAAKVLEAVREHRRGAAGTPGLERRTRSFAALSVRRIMEDVLASAIERLFSEPSADLAADIERVNSRQSDPVTVARGWLRRIPLDHRGDGGRDRGEK